MKIINQNITQILKKLVWPISLIVVILLLKWFDFSKIDFTWEKITALITVIIWPVTVLTGLLFFRRHLGNVINSLGSFKVGAQGVEMTFQNKLESAQKYQIGSGSMIPQSKSSGHINIKGSKAITPYEQLLEIRDALNNQIIRKAHKYDISTENISIPALCETLLNANRISRQSAHSFNILLDLTNSGSASITQSQVDQAKALYNNFKL